MYDNNGATTKFVYDGADVVRDLHANLTTAADYLNGPGVDDKLRQTVSGTASYFSQDNLGSTRTLTDAGGNVLSGLGYDSFGQVTSGSPATRYTYTGREADSDTDLMYYRARWYDPQAGRFISEDPIGLSGGVNSYAYVQNNLLRFTDPSGRCPQKPVSPKDDIEAPCINKIEDVFQDMKQLAGKLGGEVQGFDREPGSRFRGAQITTDGSSFKFYERALRDLGFGHNDSLDHPEGKGLQMKFMDNLWYHVIIIFPDRNQVNAYGEPLDPSAPTPGLTVHCHVIHPEGRIFGTPFVAKSGNRSLGEWKYITCAINLEVRS